LNINIHQHSGDVSFYGLTYSEMRGISAMRYQGEDVVTTELQTDWNFHPRWTALAFIGVGRATNSGLSDANTHAAGGIGFRYLGVRRLGLIMGIDLAKGPEDVVIYISFGTKFQ
jgi:outer membrane translocation and assembly module TamA